MDEQGSFLKRLATNRYIALIFICLLGFGNYFCYDTPGALEAPIEDIMSIDTTQFTTLYALYSWPNVFLCFIGGLLIDKVLGVRLGAIVFLFLLIAGQMFVGFGAFWDQFWMMQLGRFIYGLGGESLIVAQNTYCTLWFGDREINTVFGSMITVSRAGSTLAYNTMRNLFDHLKIHYEPHQALGYTLIVAAMTCVMSFVASIILALQDRRAERILNRPIIRSDDIRLRDAANFKSQFWLLTLICVLFYITIFPFISVGSKFFQTKWAYTHAEADFIVSSVYMISAILSPFIGILVDSVGRNIIFLLVAGLLVMFSHTMLALTYFYTWIPMVALGVGYSVMCCALWPLVKLVVPQNRLATAYGVMQAIQNLGLAVGANVTGYLIDVKGYINLELFFVLWVGLSVIATMALLVHDNAKNGVLNKTPAERKLLESTSE